MNTPTIASVGDISFAGGFSQRPDWSDWVDDDVRELLKADIVIGNLECVLIPDESKCKVSAYELCLAVTAEKCIAALKDAGFNVLTLGNNHILDYEREVGLKYTQKYLSDAGIKFCGAGSNVFEARKPAIVDVGKYKVGFISRVHGPSFSDINPIVAKTDKPGVALLDIQETIAACRKCKRTEGCDFVILAVHWGIQDIHYCPPEFHKIGNQLLTNGIDLIFGTHAHTIQGVTKFGDKYASWGQGNFYFHPIAHPNDPSSVLYGPASIKNRLSVVHKFCWNDCKWDVVTHPVIQNENDCICPVDNIEAALIRKKIYRKWSKSSSISFHYNWRKKEFINILHSFKNKKAYILVFRLLINPFKWWRLFCSLILKPTNR